MYRFYRKHYAPERNPLLNSVVYAGIALRFAGSALAAPLRRRLRGGDGRLASTSR
jgi:hypothetical protein